MCFTLVNKYFSYANKSMKTVRHLSKISEFWKPGTLTDCPWISKGNIPGIWKLKNLVFLFVCLTVSLLVNKYTSKQNKPKQKLVKDTEGESASNLSVSIRMPPLSAWLGLITSRCPGPSPLHPHPLHSTVWGPRPQLTLALSHHRLWEPTKALLPILVWSIMSRSGNTPSQGITSSNCRNN